MRCFFDEHASAVARKRAMARHVRRRPKRAMAGQAMVFARGVLPVRRGRPLYKPQAQPRGERRSEEK